MTPEHTKEPQASSLAIFNGFALACVGMFIVIYVFIYALENLSKILP